MELSNPVVKNIVAVLVSVLNGTIAQTVANLRSRFGGSFVRFHPAITRQSEALLFFYTPRNTSRALNGDLFCGETDANTDNITEDHSQ